MAHAALPLEDAATRGVDATREPTLDGLGDVEQVSAHRGLGGVRVSGAHGLDDRRMFGHEMQPGVPGSGSCGTGSEPSAR